MTNSIVNDDAVQDYLTVGFVPDPPSASSYIRRILAPGTVPPLDPVDLLCQIIEDATVKQGHSEVALPLSGGEDSRGLLGAALRVLPTTSIRCITFGSEANQDVVVATEICARLGLDHQIIDTNTIQWDLDRLTSSALHRWDRWKSLPEIDGLACYDAVAAAADGCTVLSGYFGDAVSGYNLAREEDARTDTEAAARAFLAWNRMCPLGDEFASGAERAPNGRTTGHDRLFTTFREFVDSHGDLLASWRGLTPFDVLNFGFRQGGRIRSIASGAYAECINPFEDPRWVAYWMSAEVSERVGQEASRRLYRTEFEPVFRDAPDSGGEPPRRSAAARIRARIPPGLKRRIPSGLKRRIPTGRPRRPPPPRNYWFEARGDPRRNATMAKVLQETLTSFDRRQIVTESALTAYRSLLGEHPTMPDDVFTVQWAASAELYLRAGVLVAPDRPR